MSRTVPSSRVPAYGSRTVAVAVESRQQIKGYLVYQQLFGIQKLPLYMSCFIIFFFAIYLLIFILSGWRKSQAKG